MRLHEGLRALKSAELRVNAGGVFYRGRLVATDLELGTALAESLERRNERRDDQDRDNAFVFLATWASARLRGVEAR